MALVHHAPCDGCNYSYLTVIAKFYSSDQFPAALDFLRDHGILPRSVQCPYCNLPCSLKIDSHQWYCGRYITYKETKQCAQCSFSISDFKGTCLEDAGIHPTELILFVNHWIQKFWNRHTMRECLGWSSCIVANWHRFCAEVAVWWLENQDPIGGQDIVVEIGGTFFVKSTCERSYQLKNIWVFGGIERISKKHFLIPLVNGEGDMTAATLIPIIKRYILPGTIINSHDWSAYNNLADEGYVHHILSHNEAIVDPEDPSIRIETIKGLWHQVKSWGKRPGIRTCQFHWYFARYCFLKSHPENTLHHFFVTIAQKFPLESQSVHPELPAAEIAFQEELDYFTISDEELEPKLKATE